jgi:hypothetical protein
MRERQAGNRTASKGLAALSADSPPERRLRARPAAARGLG